MSRQGHSKLKDAVSRAPISRPAPAERTRLIFLHTLSEGGAGVGASARTSAECRCACILQGREGGAAAALNRPQTDKRQLTNR